MAFYRQCFLIGLALALTAGRGWAAGGSREQRAYDEAVRAFHDQLWYVAEMELGQFAQKYPASRHLPEATLLQAQAEIQQGKFAQGEALLGARKAAAGSFTDAYLYWMGEAQYLRGDWRTAAATLASVPRGSADYALRAGVEAAAALARLGEWPELITFLGTEQEVIARAARSDPDNELVLRSHLLQAQAHFEQREFNATDRLLAAIKPRVLPPNLEWKRVYLLCRVKEEAGDWEAALPFSTGLPAIARQSSGADGGTNLAASVALHATVLEALGRASEAMAALQDNLAPGTPEESQRQAILRIAALAVAQRQWAPAETMLEHYVMRFSNSPALDTTLLTLGELELQDNLAQPGQTNLIGTARTRFDRLLTVWPNSPLAGKAHLDRGWCDWLAGKYGDSLPDFQAAAQTLPPSEDLAVARFKYGDALFAREDYAEALIQYQAVLAHFADFPDVSPLLGARARYQSLRVQLKLGDLAGAATNMARMAADYPLSDGSGTNAVASPAGHSPSNRSAAGSELSQTSALLLGEDYTDMRQPAKALALFQSFAGQAPDSPFRPSVELAMARAYEEEADWPKAIAQYDTWLQTNSPTNELRAQALYARARANYQAGDETNALLQFTNFTSLFPGHELAPQAQWWVADHFFRLGDWVNAERNYKTIFQNTNWQSSAAFTNALFYPALLMAGRAAVARTGYAEAIRDYFQKLEADTNCPLDLAVQATFADGSAQMKMESPDTNNLTTNFTVALTVFNPICARFSTNEWGARAWGEMGDCYLQLSRYDDATNAFQKALDTLSAGPALRCQAQIGLGVVLEKKAALAPAEPEQTELFMQALKNYWEAFNRQGEEPAADPFWTKEAGLKAANLAAALGQWPQATMLYSNLVVLMPELKPALARKMDEASQHLNPPKR